VASRYGRGRWLDETIDRIEELEVEMSDITRYLAEEIATDYGDGFFSRREALRRLALLGIGAAAACSLLAACSSGEPEGAASGASSGSAAPKASTPSSSAPPAASSPAASASARPPAVLPASLPTEAITFPGPEKRTLQGAWAAAKEPHGGVLVIHENKGLTDHIKHVAGRFAAVGYSALAIDLLSEEGGTASLGDPANATAALGKVEPTRFVADMKAGLDELAKRTPKKKLGAIGFCFGGGMTWRLVGTKDPRLAAAAPFYGPFPDGVDFAGAKTAVLGIYGALDKRVNGTRDAAEAALKKATLTHEIVTFEDADHAFFNDTGPRYQAEAARTAWSRVLDWFGKHLA
jgi:carboxymethylenebutenolidase